MLALLLTACGGNITKVKYVYDLAFTKAKLPDGSVVTAPAGKHYGIFYINCIDNSTRDEAFLFLAANLRDGDNQQSQVNPVSSWFPPQSKLVGAGDVAKNIGRVVFELSGPPASGVIEDLFYASTGNESVLMVNQTYYGPSVLLDLSRSVNVADETVPRYFTDGDNFCVDARPNPHP